MEEEAEVAAGSKDPSSFFLFPSRKKIPKQQQVILMSLTIVYMGSVQSTYLQWQDKDLKGGPYISHDTTDKDNSEINLLISDLSFYPPLRLTPRGRSNRGSASMGGFCLHNSSIDGRKPNQ